MSRKPNNYLLSGMVAVFIIIRVAAFLVASHGELFIWPTVDEATYLNEASQISGTAFSTRSLQIPFWQPPGYTLLLSLFLFAGITLKGIIIIQHAIGVINSTLVFLLLRHLLHKHNIPRANLWSIAAGLFYSLCPIVLHYESCFLKPVWVTLLLLVLYLLYIRNRSGVLVAILTGGLIGVLCLFEAYFLLLLPAWFITRGKFPRTFKTGMTATALLVILPFIIAGSIKAERPVLLSVNGGINLYIGNNPDWQKTYNTLPGWEWRKLAHKHTLGTEQQDLPTARREQLFLRDVMQFVQKTPGSFLYGLFQKAFLLFSCRELPRNDIIVFPPLISLWACIANILLAGLCGICLLAGRKKVPFIFYLILIVILINVLFFPTSRYRCMLIPFTIIGGVFMLSSSDRKLLIRHYLPTGILFIFISIAAGVFAGRIVNYNAWTAAGRLNIIERLIHQQKLKEAYHQLNMLVIDAPSVESTFQLAQFEYDITGNIPRARDLFKQCSRIAPDYPEPYYYLGGIALEHDRNPRKALNSFNRYIEKRNYCGYRPNDHSDEFLRALYYVALLNIRQGKPQPAEIALRHAKEAVTRLSPATLQRNEELLMRLQQLEKQIHPENNSKALLP